MKKSDENKVLGFPPWTRVDGVLRACGWRLERRIKDKVSYVRGYEKLTVFKTNYGKWKTDYSVNNRLVDTSGPTDEGYAKVMAIEMGALR